MAKKKTTLKWFIAICLFLTFSLLFGIPKFKNILKTFPVKTEKRTEKDATLPDLEVRAMWLNYMELELTEEERTEEVFRKKFESIFQNLKESKINTVVIQVRPFCDAIYPSDSFPFSAYFSGTQGERLDFDPLQILIELANSMQISVEAWINPYRVSHQSDFSLLSPQNPARVWQEEGKEENLILCEKGIYLNPASPAVQKLILSGVRELLTKYSLSAIHLDDYFYPSKDASIDVVQYTAYVEAGGKLSLADFRKEQVNTLLSSMYALIKHLSPDTQLVISPSGNIEHNENALYADVRLWASTEGYCDRLVPQLYYGFLHPQKPFEQTAKEWSGLVRSEKVELCFGLAAYKCGTAKGEEWKNETDILSRQIAHVRSYPNYRGIYFYGYTNIYQEKDNEIMQKEWKNVKNML